MTMLIGFLLVGASLCAVSESIATASSLQLRPDLHIVGSGPVRETLKPVILKFDLSKEGQFVRSCYGTHFIPTPANITFYWILPAECLDNSDMITVKHGYKDNSRARFYLKDVYHRIHPSYDEVTKEHNIALVGFPSTLNMEVESGYVYIQLPSAIDNLDDKIFKLYEYKEERTEKADDVPKQVLYNVVTRAINSIWCKILYPLSPIREYHICVSGLFDKGLLQDDLGTPLVARQGDNFKLVGLATLIRPWTSAVSFPMEVLKLQPYLNWIKDVTVHE